MRVRRIDSQSRDTRRDHWRRDNRVGIGVHNKEGGLETAASALNLASDVNAMPGFVHGHEPRGGNKAGSSAEHS